MTKIFLLFILFLPAVAFTQKIEVTVSPNPVSEEENVLLRVNISLAGRGQVEVPTFEAPDFDIVSSNNSRSARTTFINGKLTFEQNFTYSFILFPRKTGKLRISDIKSIVDGKSLQGDDVIVQVKAAAESTNNTNDKGSLPFNSDFSVRVELSKTEVYVGEPIIATYYVYDYFNLKSLDVKKWPSFDGFWKEDLEIPNRYNFRAIVINGKRMRRALLGKFAIYPLKPGKIEIPKLVFQGTYTVNLRGGGNNYDPFANFFQPTRSAVHASQEIKINALPLPQTNVPPSFGGAVGDLKIDLKADKTELEAHKPITVTFTVSGVGNFNAIEDPPVLFPDSFEIYESKSNSTQLSNSNLGALAQKKEFSYLLIPRQEGSFEIPKVTWAYFDTKAKVYRELQSDNINITVTKGTAASATTAATPAIDQQTPQDPALPKQTLSYLKKIDNVTSSNFFAIQNWIKWLFYTLLAVFFILLGFAVYKNSEKIRLLRTKKETKNDQIQKLLDHIKNLDKNSVWSDLEKFVYSFLSIVLEETTSGMTKSELKSKWVSKGLEEADFSTIENTLSECEKFRYASVVANDVKAKESVKVIGQLESLAKRINIL